MAYPKDYQDAEHRRALGALLNDLETTPVSEAEGCTDAIEPDEGLCSSEAAPRDAVRECGAEIHLRTAKRLDVEVSQQSAN